MKLLLNRRFKQKDYTIGDLYIDGTLFCNTLEDTDRGLNNDMYLETIQRVKVANKTAIPTGTYYVDMNTVSPKYSGSAFMKEYANGARVPRLQDVPGFSGVLIHTGNTAEDTAGCILVGLHDRRGHLTNSRDTFKKLYPILQKADHIDITIV